MQPILSSRFQQFKLDEKEDEHARLITPYTFAFIQNKIAVYANAAVEFSYDSSKELSQQVIEHEKIKAQIQVMEELLQELQVPKEFDQQPNPQTGD